MRILCDQNVPRKYIVALQNEQWATVTTVGDELARDASDDEIASFATENDWVVFTNDDDFFDSNISHGLLVFSQLEDPKPGEVIAAVAEVERAYDADDEIVEHVPNGWV